MTGRIKDRNQASRLAPGPAKTRDDGVTVRNLEVFIAAARGGGMAEGAKAMGLSKTAVTLAVKRLERKLGVELFSRGRGKVKEITPNGILLLKRAERPVRELRALLDQPLRKADR